MRPICDIEGDLRAARQHCVDLQEELAAARLAEFLREAGVPVGARPVFELANGERVLLDRFEGIFPEGALIRKDGSISHATRRTLYRGGARYVGERGMDGLCT